MRRHAGHHCRMRFPLRSASCLLAGWCWLVTAGDARAQPEAESSAPAPDEAAAPETGTDPAPVDADTPAPEAVGDAEQTEAPAASPEAGSDAAETATPLESIVHTESGDPHPAESTVPEQKPGESPESQPEKTNEEPEPNFPRLVLSVHGTLGPHSVGEETCRQQGSAFACDRTGRFLGIGGAVGFRIRLYKFIYANLRFNGQANAFGTKEETLHDALLTPSAGIMLMSDLAFLRAEFLAPITIGDDQYRAPGTTQRATETWGHAAGGLALGARLRFHDRIRGELTAGVQVGPGVDRDTPTEGDRKGPLVSFQVGLGTSFDLVGAK